MVRIARHVRACLVVAVAIQVAGCVTPSSGPAHVDPGQRPTYRQVARRYNHNITGLDRLWARTVVELHWRDDHGKSRFEQGDGNLVISMPDKLAMSVGKLGNVMLWLGGDAERYWLFDLQGEKLAYVGRHDRLDEPGRKALPLPVRPRDLPRLLGIVPIDPDAADAAGSTPAMADEPVEVVNGYYLLEPPGARMRLLLDPKTARPVRIDLIDAKGYSRVICRLSKPEPVELFDAAPGAFPHIASSLQITLPDRDARMLLILSAMTNEPDKVKDRAFDFDYLVKVLKPTRIENVDGP